MVVPCVKSDGLPMKGLQGCVLRIIDKHKSLNLRIVNNSFPKQKKANRTHFRDETYIEFMASKIDTMVGTQKHAVSWFMPWTLFCTLRDPTTYPKV
jgi:hypothetical protein